MSLHLRALVALSALALMTPAATHAQETEIQALRREMQEMRRDYEARLQQMEQRLEAATRAQAQPPAQSPGAAPVTTARTAAPPTPTSPASAPAPATTASVTGGILGTPPTGAEGPAYAPTTSAFRTPQAAASSANSFNPAIGAILDGKFSAQSGNPDRYRVRGFSLGDEAQPAPRGFAIGESEVNAQANVDQWLFGNLTIAFAQDNSVEVEEAFMQTTSLPYGFTLKGGRFFSGVGYMNEQHAHVWDFVDPALPYRAFLNNQYRDDGVQLRWLAPTNVFLEFGAEGFRGDAFPAGGAARHGVGSYTAFAHLGDDINESSSYRVGLSYLSAESRERRTNNDADLFTGRNNIGILDAVYKWAPDGNPVDRNLKLQGELFLGRNSGVFSTNGSPFAPFTQQQWGWYAQAVYQFMPRWRVGVRHDEVRATGALDYGDAFQFTALDDSGQVDRRSSAMVDYSTSEFGRIRFQYNNDRAGPTVDHQLFLQYVVSIGAHGAHQF
jgi:hypothetical protein